MASQQHVLTITEHAQSIQSPGLCERSRTGHSLTAAQRPPPAVNLPGPCLPQRKECGILSPAPWTDRQKLACLWTCCSCLFSPTRMPQGTSCSFNGSIIPAHEVSHVFSGYPLLISESLLEWRSGCRGATVRASSVNVPTAYPV